MIQLSDMRSDQFLLDTQTGKVWQRRCIQQRGDECTSTAWMIDDVEGITISYKELQDSIKKDIWIDDTKPKTKPK